MRTPSIMLLCAVTLAAISSMPAVAAANEDDSYIAVVTGDNVYVRSGAADSYYPFGRVNRGDLVKVTGEKFNWGRVATLGPTFTSDRFFGYIIYPTTQPGRFRLSADGKSGIVLGRADVLAPNLNTNNNPNDSWKPLIRLEAGTDVTVLETSTTANNTVHKIVLPEASEAWISMAYLRRANDEQVRQWEAAMRPEPEVQDDEAEPEAPVADAPREPQPSTGQPETQPAETEEPAPAVTPVAPEQQSPQQPQPSPAPTSSPQPAEQTPAPSSQPQQPEQVQTPAEIAPESEPETIEADEPETVMPALGNVPAEATTSQQAEPPLSERLAQATLEDLEQAYEQLRKDDVEQAEFGPLREMYLSFANRVEESDRTGASFARSRAEQLALLSDVQERRHELNQIRARARISAERAEAARLAVDAGGDYVAVGRLSSSTIYDGKRLPRMLRLQDPGTGRTVAYIEPDDGYDMAGMLDQLIGVIGEKTYDGGLRLNVLKPRRIDILAPR